MSGNRRKNKKPTKKGRMKRPRYSRKGEQETMKTLVMGLQGFRFSLTATIRWLSGLSFHPFQQLSSDFTYLD